MRRRLARYIPSARGDRLEECDLDTFDFAIRSAVETSLRGDLNDQAWDLATCGVKQGGLGMRSAKRTALAASVASLIGSRPLVHSMCSDMVLGGLWHLLECSKLSLTSDCSAPWKGWKLGYQSDSSSN